GAFDIHEVAAELSEKMVLRDPHGVAADGTLLSAAQRGEVTVELDEENWEQMKEAENEKETATAAATTDHDVPAGVPVLAAAATIVDRAGRQPQNPLDESPQNTTLTINVTQDDIGSQLFELVRVARAHGVDLEAELRQHNGEASRQTRRPV